MYYLHIINTFINEKRPIIFTFFITLLIKKISTKKGQIKINLFNLFPINDNYFFNSNIDLEYSLSNSYMKYFL